MGRHSKISQAPAALREELSKKLARGDFRNDRKLAYWLGERDCMISRQTANRHRQRFEEHMKAMRIMTEEARAIVEASPDDQGQVNDALVRLVQSKLQNLLIELDLDTPDLTRIARAVADLGRTAVGQKRWASEMRERLERQKLAAVETIGRIAREGGLSDDAERAIRAALFAINPLPGAASPGVTA